MGLNPRRIEGNIYSVYVSVLGNSEVGPYEDLLDFVGRTDLYVLPVQVHHIVNGEHLHHTGWKYKSAPCIVLGKQTHEQYHGRFSETLPEYHSRRNIGRISGKHALQLYHDMFFEQTEWHELWSVAARILTNRVRVPSVQEFWRGEM